MKIFLTAIVAGMLLLSLAAVSVQAETSNHSLRNDSISENDNLNETEDINEGDFEGPDNESMHVERENSHKTIKIGKENNSDFETEMNISLEKNESNKTHLNVHLSNGRFSEVKIMPATASARALEVLGAKCEERNCTIELKEAGKGNETKAVYKVHAKKDVKILGLFKAQMNVDADIDANNGEVIAKHEPWWAVISTAQ